MTKRLILRCACCGRLPGAGGAGAGLQRLSATRTSRTSGQGEPGGPHRVPRGRHPRAGRLQRLRRDERTPRSAPSCSTRDRRRRCAAAANAEPIAEGPGCAGCHSGNYDAGRPSPNAAGVYPWRDTLPTSPATTPSASPSSAAPRATTARTWPRTAGPTTAHRCRSANMANADICGQCHSRYSNTADTYTITPNPTPRSRRSRRRSQPPTADSSAQLAIGFEPRYAPAAGRRPR